MSDCRFGVSPVNYPDPDPDKIIIRGTDCATEEVMSLIQISEDQMLICNLTHSL